MKNLAYDFAKFEQKPKQPEQKQVQFKRVQKQPVVTQKSSRPILILTMFLALLTIIGAMIFSQIQLTELAVQIDSKTKLLDETTNENTRLNLEINCKLSLNKVEEYALNNLGLVKISPSQIEYIKLSKSNQVVVKKVDESNFFVYISNRFNDFLEYLS